MKNYENEMIKVLHALNDSGALPYVIISGSWSMYFYKKIFEGFIPRVETTDLDLFLPNPKKAKSEKLGEHLKAISYIKNNDYITGKTMFLSDNGFSIEFLTIPNRTMSNTLEIPGMLVVAEALPKMAPAGWNYIQMDLDGMLINITSPVSFVLQKLLINGERKSDYKKEKDLDAIKYVLGFVKSSNKYNQELAKSLESYPKKWKKIIIETAKENKLEL